MKNQGKRESQVNFSNRVVHIGYFGMLLLIVGFIIYEWLK